MLIMKNNKYFNIIKTIFKLCVVTLASIFLFVGIYYLLKTTGWIGKFNNMQELKKIILSAGFWSYCVFTVLQFLQVTILPLPAMVTTIVGVIIFGPFIAFILSCLAIILGSIFAFYLGKGLGIKLLYWAIGKDKTTLMQQKMERGKFLFFLMMLFPLFPDDILCMLAGVMNMDFKFFLITNLITRPVGLFCICFISTGIIIPFHSWGLIVWAVIFIVLLTLFICSIKFKDKIESIINSIKIKKATIKIK